MSEVSKWAQEYVKTYENYVAQRTQAGTAVVGGTEYELYKLAKAILEDKP